MIIHVVLAAAPSFPLWAPECCMLYYNIIPGAHGQKELQTNINMRSAVTF